MMLKDKVAVIYGAGGAIGAAVARAFASEGATVFLTGHALAPVTVVAEDIVAACGSAEAAEVDALNEYVVDRHLQAVIDMTGRIDISFDAIGIPQEEEQGILLTDLPLEAFALPIVTHATSYFLTARLAARRMIPNRSGVIMTVTSLLSRTGIPLVGGYGPAMAAKEALTRELSAELAPHGIRVVGLRPQGMPETRTVKDGYKPRAKGVGDDLGTVAREAGKQNSSATSHETRGDGAHGGLHGLRQSERDDRNDPQPDHGKPRRLATERARVVTRCEMQRPPGFVTVRSRRLSSRRSSFTARRPSWAMDRPGERGAS
jgi:NAD(P)-dependent dehydrogenase (short-subunit alcohol dehydrogenase family)